MPVTKASRASASCAAAQGDAIVLTTYGRSSGFCVDPIEKKPLNHFLPGRRFSRSAPRAATWPASSARTGTSSKSREIDSRRRRLARRIARAPSSWCRASPSPTTIRHFPGVRDRYAQACREGHQGGRGHRGLHVRRAAARVLEHMDAANVISRPSARSSTGGLRRAPPAGARNAASTSSRKRMSGSRSRHS